jgi:penicillin-binding protein 1A
MNQMLRGVVSGGTARSVGIGGRDLAGKTGTTSDYKDAWFVGYTGGFVTAVWVGKDDNTAMRGVTGGAAPAAIWKGFMEAALPRLNAPRIPDGPPMPEGWVPPDPMSELMGSIEDPYAEGEELVTGGGVEREAPEPNAPPVDRPVVRPTVPQPTEPRRPETTPAPERKSEPLFF